MAGITCPNGKKFCSGQKGWRKTVLWTIVTLTALGMFTMFTYWEFHSDAKNHLHSNDVSPASLDELRK